MEIFFNSLFPFFVIAFVGVRILSLIRRRKNKQQQEGGRATAPKKSARGFVPWEDEFRDTVGAGNTVVSGKLRESSPAQTASDDDDDDEAFSAWNLSVDDAPAPVEPLPAPKRLSDALRPSLFAAAPESATQPPRPVPAPATRPVFPMTTPENTAQPMRPVPAPRPKQRFSNLLPLQQAVVWAEILGTPKGLQNERFVNPE
jgi:hypothetical protein